MCYHLFCAAQQEAITKKLSLLTTEKSHLEDRIKMLEIMCTEPDVETEVEIKELAKGLPAEVQSECMDVSEHVHTYIVMFCELLGSPCFENYIISKATMFKVYNVFTGKIFP